MLRTLALLFSSFIWCSASDHPIHLASHELTVRDGRTDWVIKVFTDDLEAAIAEANPGVKVRLERPEARKLVEQYVAGRLQVSRGRKQLTLVFDGLTYQPDAVEIRLHLASGLPLTVTDRLLHERFTDQRNVYFVRGPQGRLDALCTPSQPNFELRYPK
jgi:hypothetical protein